MHNQIRLFRLFLPFRLFHWIRLLDFPALVQTCLRRLRIFPTMDTWGDSRQRYLQTVWKTETKTLSSRRTWRKAWMLKEDIVEKRAGTQSVLEVELFWILSFGINHTSCTTCSTIVKPNQNIYKLWDSSAVHSRTAEEEHRECSSLRPSQLSFFPWCHGPSHCTVLHTTGAMVPPPPASLHNLQYCAHSAHSAHSSNTQHCQLPAHGNPTWGKVFK